MEQKNLFKEEELWELEQSKIRYRQLKGISTSDSMGFYQPKRNEFLEKPSEKAREWMMSTEDGLNYKKRLTELKENLQSFLRVRTNGSESKLKGETSKHAHYTDHEVLQCMELRLEGYSLRAISEKMDIPIRTLRDFFAGTRRAIT